MNKLPLVSVVIPVYNVELYLQKCIDSITSQTYSNLEIILIDDGSPDNCPQICDEYAAKDKRIKTIHKKNGGLSDARNVGIDTANGEFISFVDSDDYVDENFIEKLYNAITKNDSDMAICNFSAFSMDSGFPIPKYTKIDASKFKEGVVNEKEFWELTKDPHRAVCAASCSKLYKMEIFNNIRFPIGKIHEDEFVLHHIISKCRSIALVNDTLYFYLQRTTSIIGSKNKQCNFDAIEAYMKRYKYFISKKWFEHADICISRMRLILLREHYFSQNIFSKYYATLNKLSIRPKRQHKFIFIIENILFKLSWEACAFAANCYLSLKYKTARSD